MAFSPPSGSKYLYSTYIGPTSEDIGTSLRPRYIPDSYMDLLGLGSKDHHIGVLGPSGEGLKSSPFSPKPHIP